MKSKLFGTRATVQDIKTKYNHPITPIQPIHTCVPGRARLKVASLYRSQFLKHRLESMLFGVSGITTIRVNELTGNLLVVFDRDRSLGDIVRIIVDTLENAAPSGKDPALQVATQRRPASLQITRPEPVFGLRALDVNALPVTILASSPLVLLPVAFIRTFLVGLFQASPILILFTTSIALLGLMVGKKEGWERSDALYFAFVTASTVGYGDLRPTQKSTKILSIVIGLLGLVMTGMVTALGVYSAQRAFESLPRLP